jgi:hypothetical protein
LFYSTKSEKQNFELLVIKDTSISRMQLKNSGLDGGGAWYKSAVIAEEKLLLLHVDGFLVLYEKNKKGNYVLKGKINIEKQTGRYFGTISWLDSETILLMNSYDSYNQKALYDNYALCTYNLSTKKIIVQKEIDVGKGILLSYFSSTVTMESKKDKIAVAHPTLPLIYIYNDKLNPIDTVYAQFQDTISIDSVVNTIFSDSFLELNRYNAKGIVQIIDEKKINQLERIEKVFWFTDDILGYTIRQPFSEARVFVFYSFTEKREIYRKIDTYSYSGIPMCTNFVSSTRILVYNNKTVWFDYIYENDQSDYYYEFSIYDGIPFIGAK